MSGNTVQKSVPSFSLGIILSTWNKPRALRRILHAFVSGSCTPGVIVVADDGSGPATEAVVREVAKEAGFPILHAWHANEGHRKSRILNKAIAMAHSDYWVFVDGDCVPHKRFVEDHRALAYPGSFVQARRAFIKEEAVDDFIEKRASLLRLLLKGKITGAFKLIRTPVPLIRSDQDLSGILGCNLGIWRKDLIQVNGFDENYVGWGAEDSDLAARLYHLGRQRRLVHGRALLYHLNHPVLSRDRYSTNKDFLRETLKTKKKRCVEGLDQHLSERRSKC